MADPVSFDLVFHGGAMQLDATSDIALGDTVASLPEDLGFALAAQRGSVPYFPEDGASAESAEGSSGATTADLARRARAQVARDPDVLRVGDVSARVDSAGLAVFGVSATTRRDPRAAVQITVRLPA